MNANSAKLDLATAPKGRATPIMPPTNHYIFDRPLLPPYPAGFEIADLGMGCFWGAERLFWELGQGIWITASGYAGGVTPNPTYEEICTANTGHTEVVRVVFDPVQIPYAKLLKMFWEAHNPTQGNRQGDDIGPQYRSAIFTTTDAQYAAAVASRDVYARELAARCLGTITTEIKPAPEFYFAEQYQQQYLAKVPDAQCEMRGTGVTCPMQLSSRP